MPEELIARCGHHSAIFFHACQRARATEIEGCDANDTTDARYGIDERDGNDATHENGRL